MVFEIGGEFMNIDTDIAVVIGHLYTELCNAKKLSKAVIYSDGYLGCIASRYHCYGIIEALFLLGLISRERYFLLNKAVDTLDISIIEEFIYELSKQRSTK